MTRAGAGLRRIRLLSKLNNPSTQFSVVSKSLKNVDFSLAIAELDKTAVAIFLFVPIILRCMSLLVAQSGHFRRTRECPLLEGGLN
jgi:hypothetical protein